MSIEDKRIVEINGVKIEIDLRTAKRVDSFKVGDAVKVLKKSSSYGDSYNSYFGMIVGFDEFRNLPTIIVAYLNPGYGSDSPLKFEYLNAKSTDVEICSSDEKDIGIDKADILSKFENELVKKEQELADIKRKKEYFLAHFGRYFT